MCYDSWSSGFRFWGSSKSKVPISGFQVWSSGFHSGQGCGGTGAVLSL